MTYRELKNALAKLDEKQLEQNVQLLPPSHLHEGETMELWPVIELMTVEDCFTIPNTGEYDGTVTRSADDNAHHPEQLVFITDINSFDEEGNSSWTLTEEGFVGNKTGKVVDL